MTGPDVRHIPGDKVEMKTPNGDRIGTKEFVGYWPEPNSASGEVGIWRMIEIEPGWEGVIPPAWGVAQ